MEKYNFRWKFCILKRSLEKQGTGVGQGCPTCEKPITFASAGRNPSPRNKDFFKAPVNCLDKEYSKG